MNAGQLPLDLGHRPALGREDFLVSGCNALAVEWLDRWPDWPAPGAVLVGPSACGKSHLLAAFAASAPARLVSARALTSEDLPHLVEDTRIVLVDDVSAQADPALLFHLFNLCRQHAVHMIFAARMPVAQLGLTLADLSSRLATLPHLQIGAPDDALLTAVMAKLFADRQLAVGPDVLSWAVGRMERSFEAARALVDALDRASLAQSRAITIPLARQVLGG